jgi:hypothetical protein
MKGEQDVQVLGVRVEEGSGFRVEVERVRGFSWRGLRVVDEEG